MQLQDIVVGEEYVIFNGVEEKARGWPIKMSDGPKPYRAMIVGKRNGKVLARMRGCLNPVPVEPFNVKKLDDAVDTYLNNLMRQNNMFRRLGKPIMLDDELLAKADQL